jgi:NAD(P)-dependent dehydrogenase (short-subunit alcohol dehydrogenase family)
MTILDKFRLDGRIAIVTDGSAPLGAALARGLAEAGADVVLAARHAGHLNNAASIIRDTGRRAVTVEADVNDPSQCSALVEAAINEFGKVDVLVNNAELVDPGQAIDLTVEDFRSVIDSNLHSSYWAAKACGLVMRPGSSIVNISGVAALTTLSLPRAAYSASAAALTGLTRDLAQQWGSRKGIRVNTIAQGFIDASVGHIDSPVESHSARIVLGRNGTPEEIASTLVWLASEAGSYVTGQTIVVDGGVSLT